MSPLSSQKLSDRQAWAKCRTAYMTEKVLKTLALHSSARQSEVQQVSGDSNDTITAIQMDLTAIACTSYSLRGCVKHVNICSSFHLPAIVRIFAHIFICLQIAGGVYSSLIVYAMGPAKVCQNVILAILLALACGNDWEYTRTMRGSCILSLQLP